MRLHRARGRARAVSILLAGTLLVAGCSDSDGQTRPPSTPPPTVQGDCGTVRIAYDPSNGYEASAFIVGILAAEQLDCTVEYVRTTSRQAWRLVADGRADAYLDAYGSPDLRERFARDGGPVEVVGPNGVKGGVDLLAPAFMMALGLETAPDLDDTEKIGWGSTTPAITTLPALLRLAEAFVEFQQLDDYIVRDYEQIRPRSGMADLLQKPAEDDERGLPNLYLVEGPRGLLGDSPGRASVSIPESADAPCVPDARTTLCSLRDFRYQKIVNAEFADSGSPAYALIFEYQLESDDVGTILELVQLSGYDVGEPDVASWINTHKATWRRWIS